MKLYLNAINMGSYTLELSFLGIIDTAVEMKRLDYALSREQETDGSLDIFDQSLGNLCKLLQVEVNYGYSLYTGNQDVMFSFDFIIKDCGTKDEPALDSDNILGAIIKLMSDHFKTSFINKYPNDLKLNTKYLNEY